MPDAVHGDSERYATLVQLLATPEVDWIAIEMLDVSLQDELQVFMKGEANTEAWQEVRGTLLAYYEQSWNRFARNVVWAKQLPGTGWGLVFGGSGHMIRGAAANVQYFIRTLQPGTALYHHYVEHAP